MKRKTRSLSIKIKITLTTSLLMIGMILFLGISFYVSMEKSMISMGIEQAQVAARVAVSQVDEGVAGLKPGDEDTEEYQRATAALREVKQTCSVAYLYTLYADENTVRYGVDTDETQSRNGIGAVFEVSYEELRPVFQGSPYVQDYIDSTENGDLITVYVPILGSDGRVAAVLGSDYDASGIVERLRDMRMRILLIGIIGVLAALILLFLTARSITQGIWKVNSKLYELVHNEGDLTQSLQIRTGDEMELMAENVNKLFHYIREIMRNISGNTLKLNDSTKTVSENVSSASDSIMNISATMQEMSAAMEESTATLSQLNQSMGEVSAHVNYIAEKAEAGNEYAREIESKAGKIYNDAEKEQSDAHVLVTKMADSMNEKLERSKSVDEINELTENIISITGRTNLLALNASIEAARAGEAGKGFSVVAGEIGKLASTSAESAARIKQVSAEVISAVEGLALEARQMVVFMDETAMEGYRKLLATSQGYQEDAQHIHEMMDHFASNSEELEKTVNDIKEAMQSVSTAVEENARGIVNVSDAAGKLTENIGDIAGRADMNRQIGGQLEFEVGKFKLE